MANVEIGTKDGTDYSNDAMYAMASEMGIPDIYIRIEGFQYFVGPDGYMWQSDTFRAFPDISTQNTHQWTKELYGENPDTSDKETQHVLNQNNAALAALNAKLEKAGK
jgi:hypothetical protein